MIAFAKTRNNTALAGMSICLALLSGGFIQAQNTEPADAAALFKKAYELTKTAKTTAELAEVIDLCQQGLGAKPEEPVAAYGRQLLSWSHNKRGETLAGAGQEEAALADFEKSIELDSSRWKTLHNRGVSYATLGRYDEAAADFDRVIQLQPGFATAWFNRGELHYLQGRLAEALRDYDQALRLDPDDTLALTSRGHAHYRRGNYRAAISDYSQAIRLNPNNSAAHAHRAVAYADLSRYDEAARDFRTAIRLDSNSEIAYQGAGWLMATCSNPRYRDAQRAVDAAKKAIELAGEEHFRYLDTLAAAYANAGQFEEAVKTQQKTIEQAASQPAETIAELNQRLELYKQGRPYREGK